MEFHGRFVDVRLQGIIGVWQLRELVDIGSMGLTTCRPYRGQTHQPRIHTSPPTSPRAAQAPFRQPETFPVSARFHKAKQAWSSTGWGLRRAAAAKPNVEKSASRRLTCSCSEAMDNDAPTCCLWAIGRAEKADREREEREGAVSPTSDVGAKAVHSAACTTNAAASSERILEEDCPCSQRAEKPLL
eukprot:2589446-Rhodomonas_salina.1